MDIHRANTHSGAYHTVRTVALILSCGLERTPTTEVAALYGDFDLKVIGWTLLRERSKAALGTFCTVDIGAPVGLFLARIERRS